MTVGEKRAAWLIGVLAAFSRWLAMARSPWDSDEGLFMSALRHYDVVAHHPHPPGFPLFIGLAKLFTFAGVPGFRALQLISFAAAVAIVPAAILLGRALGATPRVSMMAGALLAFFPNVWFFGGTAFSDVPSMTLSMVVVALLLGGAAVSGGVLLGIAIGFRPQTLLIAIVPALIGALKGVKVTGSRGSRGENSDSLDSLRLLDPLRRIAKTVVVTAIIVAVSYGAAVHLSGGWQRYSNSLAEHQQYITTHDSFRASLRPPMWELFDNFFLRPYDAPLINTIISALVAVSGVVTLVRRRPPMLLLLGAYGPFCIAAWALLDRFSTSRFSIGYAPLIAFLAADGLALLFKKYDGVAAAAIVALMIVWSWPAIEVVHRTISPPFAAAEWVRHHQGTAYVADELHPISDALLAGVTHFDPGPPPLTAAMRAGDVYVREGISTAPGTIVFRRERGRLASIARSTRYFEVSIVPVRDVMLFTDGWYDEERSGPRSWRWMGRRGRIALPPHLARMRLSISLYVPLDALPTPPNITVTFNGATIDRLHATEKDLERTYDVNARIDGPNELVIETDETVNPAARGLKSDARDLGVRVNDVIWSAR